MTFSSFLGWRLPKAADNLEIVKGLRDASQILSLTDAQRSTVNEMLTNAERLNSGNGGDVELLQTQVQSVPDLWSEGDPTSSDIVDGVPVPQQSPEFTATVTEPTVAKLTEAFMAGVEGRRYEPEASFGEKC